MSYPVYISKGEVPLWRKILGEIGILYIFYLAYWTFEEYRTAELEDKADVLYSGLIIIILISVIISACFTVWDYHFDFERMRYRIVRRILFISFGKWRPFRKLDYVAVYRKADWGFEVKLFYDNGKNFYIQNYFSYNEALEVGKELARRLDLELWDTSDFENPIQVNPYDIVAIPEFNKIGGAKREEKE